MRILVVEDEPPVSAFARRVLEDLGSRVDVVDTASAALEMIQDDSRSYHVVVLDRVLPDMPGDEVAFEIQALRPDIAIVLASGRIRTGRPVCDSWLEKPYGADDLVRKVLKALAVCWRRNDRARHAKAQPVTASR